MKSESVRRARLKCVRWDMLHRSDATQDDRKALAHNHNNIMRGAEAAQLRAARRRRYN